jgi:hypothetical protein
LIRDGADPPPFDIDTGKTARNSKSVGAGCANARTLSKRFAASQPHTGFTMVRKAVQTKQRCLRAIAIRLKNSSVGSTQRNNKVNVVRIAILLRIASSFSFQFFCSLGFFGRGLQAKMEDRNEGKYLKIGEVRIYW